MRNLIGFTLIICACITSIACSYSSPFQYDFDGYTMGTSYNVKVVSTEKIQEDILQNIHRAIEDALVLVDSSMSTFKPDSELSYLNRFAIDLPFVVSKDLLTVLLYSKKLYVDSKGMFDITVAPLVNLWGFGTSGSTGRVPSAEKIHEIGAYVGSNHFSIDHGQVVKHKPVQFDLSALAKGFAVDQVALSLDALGIDNYLLEVGGEIIAKGLSQRGDPWVIGIEAPDHEARRAHTAVELNNASMATSGDYRNFFEADGRHYSHTLDPTTSFPVEHQLASVSVVSNSCMAADALATTLMVLGDIDGFKYAEDRSISAYFIYRNGDSFETKWTSSFQQYFSD